MDALPADDQALLRAAIVSDRLIEQSDVAISDALDGAVASIKLEEYAPHEALMLESEAGCDSTESPEAVKIKSPLPLVERGRGEFVAMAAQTHRYERHE
ncbi:hypothetical protein [Herpetosiphon giganteus]|uniref:hypothetical protein n=1 Tax=Herpetosiphon giganteus TaxID=2029754 RepID=UPI0019578977|nr:hypothetical protein [Herpetosiphon giganteus]MBM7845606.1 hypothetical protein [Herpetosiphon giganteus]